MLALHAAGFVWQDSGWAVAGASGAGKTGALLAFMSRGARFLSADRLRIDGADLHGDPAPIRVRAWHARQLATVHRVLDAPTRWRFGIMGAPQAAFDVLPKAARSRLLAPLIRRLDRRAFVDLDPAVLAPDLATRAPFAGVLFLARATTQRPRLVELDTAAAVDALVALVHLESATPGGATADAGATRAALARALDGKRVVQVEHAHGAALDALVDAVLEVLDARPPCASST
jgi:hypothetical protein